MTDSLNSSLEAKSNFFWIEDAAGHKLALIVRNSFISEGVEFVTGNESQFQVGFMTRQKGEYIDAHIHEIFQRTIFGTHEFLLIQSGELRLDIFDASKQYIESVFMFAGDMALLCEGGHGIAVLKEARILEVKQGPYVEGKDKTRFNHVLPENLLIREIAK